MDDIHPFRLFTSSDQPICTWLQGALTFITLRKQLPFKAPFSNKIRHFNAIFLSLAERQRLASQSSSAVLSPHSPKTHPNNCLHFLYISLGSRNSSSSRSRRCRHQSVSHQSFASWWDIINRYSLAHIACNNPIAMYDIDRATNTNSLPFHRYPVCLSFSAPPGCAANPHSTVY